MPTVIIKQQERKPFPFKWPATHDTRPAVEALAMCARQRPVAERAAVALGVRVAAEREERQEVAA